MMISQRTFLVLGLALASTIHFLVTSTNQSLCLYSVSNDSFSQQAVVNKDASQTYASTESFEGPYHIPTPYEKEVIARMVNYSFSRSQVIMTPANRSSFFKSDGDRCAFNFYGLPRSFLTMTLPSVIENILIPNANYDCHAFVYYHYIVEEAKGRSGDGGKINPDEILLLEEAMRQVGERIHGPGYQPVVRFRNFTEEHFWTVHAEILNKTRTTFDEEGHNVYMPKPDPSYNNVVVDNIIRMWHGQREVWRLMEETMQELHVNYTRVAMLRSDVLYSTRIHILDNGKGQIDYENRFAVLPGFARFPTNDRFIMGPYRGVKPWATQRFRLLDGHLLGNKRRGGFWWGIQSEVRKENRLSVLGCYFNSVPIFLTKPFSICFWIVVYSF